MAFCFFRDIFHNYNWFHFKYRFGFVWVGMKSGLLVIIPIASLSCQDLPVVYPSCHGLAFRVAALSGVDPQLTGISFRIVRLRI